MLACLPLSVLAGSSISHPPALQQPLNTCCSRLLITTAAETMCVLASCFLDSFCTCLSHPTHPVCHPFCLSHAFLSTTLHLCFPCAWALFVSLLLHTVTAVSPHLSILSLISCCFNPDPEKQTPEGHPLFTASLPDGCVYIICQNWTGTQILEWSFDDIKLLPPSNIRSDLIN